MLWASDEFLGYVTCPELLRSQSVLASEDRLRLELPGLTDSLKS